MRVRVRHPGLGPAVDADGHEGTVHGRRHDFMRRLDDRLAARFLKVGDPPLVGCTHGRQAYRDHSNQPARSSSATARMSSSASSMRSMWVRKLNTQMRAT